MNDADFDQALDALVAGRELDHPDDLTRFVQDIYREERTVNMPNRHRTQFAAVLAGPISSAPEATPEYRQVRRFTWLAVAAAALLAMTGLFNWSMPTGDNDGRFLGIPSAIPTVQATPVAMASPNAEWLMPIDFDDCPMTAIPATTPVSMGTTLQNFPVRVQYPLQQADYFPRMEAWQGARDIRACMSTVDIQTFWSDRYTYERYKLLGIDPLASGELEADRIMRGQVLSSIYVNQVGVTHDALVLRYNVGDPGVEGLDPGTYAVVNPDWILEAPDGRLIVLVTSLVVSDGDLPLNTINSSQVGGLAWVLIKDDDEWRIDEYLPVCFQDEETCASFWAEQPGWATYVEQSKPRPMPDDAACVISEEFHTDYVVSAGREVNLRPGPAIASGDPVTTVEDGESLKYLCHSELTSDPKGDDLYEDEYWLFVRTSDGVEGWIRSFEVQPAPQISTPVAPLEPVGTTSVPTPTRIASEGDNQLPPIEPVKVNQTPTSTPGA